jgi:uncharacterized protein DUF6703
VAAPSPGRRPLPKGETFFTPDASAMRRAIERRSAALLVFLHQLPRWLLPLTLLAALIAGFTVHGWIGAAALALVALFLGWFSYLSWPTLTANARLLRVIAIAAVLALAALQAAR